LPFPLKLLESNECLKPHALALTLQTFGSRDYVILKKTITPKKDFNPNIIVWRTGGRDTLFQGEPSDMPMRKKRNSERAGTFQKFPHFFTLSTATLIS
jgi:hypothetical protein